jgi:hypothetical protein
MRNSKRQALTAVRAVAASALLGGAAIAVSAFAPAAAQQAGALGHWVDGVVTCHVGGGCSGGVNTGLGLGVVGVSAKNNGVDGATKNSSGQTGPGRSGVYGHDDSTDGGLFNVGVAGYSSSGTGVVGTGVTGNGVTGSSKWSDGVLGTSDNGIGIYALSLQNFALVATSAKGNNYSTLQVNGGTNDNGGSAIRAFNSDVTQIFNLDNAGNLSIHGQLFTTGACATGCSRTRRVTSYEPRESVPSMEDVGEGQLVNGRARVSLDPAYANVIDRHSSYLVFVTPEGPSRGLYVMQRDANGFTVMENPGGPASVAFAYRIVAKPYGATAARLPMTDLTQRAVPKLQHAAHALTQSVAR